ncbi:MAG: DUF1801 domain-containing protein [Terrimonas sp.]|nr:DUF1801 domain-containing protein [Terrimonas sp.]
MNIQQQINNYISGQPATKRSELQALHQRMLELFPGVRLWFDDGKNSENKTTNNPTIGYGLQTLQYANGKTKDFFQIGISGNATGISVYILGIKDKKYLANTFAKKLGKATVTGYCIRFKTLKDIDIDTLESAIRYGLSTSLPG